MRFTVTRKHIGKGVACSTDRCPVALAIKEKIPECEVWASDANIDITLNNLKWEKFSTPKQVASFIREFDRYTNTRPILKGVRFSLPINKKFGSLVS